MASGHRGKRRRRIEKRRILVVTEGTVTERDYLEKLRQELRDATVLDVKPVGRDPLTVVRKAEERAAAAGKKGKGYDAAGRVGPNPSTALPVLIEKMRPPSP